MKQLRRTDRSRGVTLVELLVVLALLSLMAAVAIPAIGSIGNYMRTDLQRSAQELHSMLRAARIYATTHRVDTAIAYSLDSFGQTSGIGLQDNVTGQTVRTIVAAAMVYERNNLWSSVPGDDGQFKSFPGGMGIPLLDLLPGADYLSPLYTDTSQATYDDALDIGNRLSNQYGMSTVAFSVSDPLGVQDVAKFPAHVFNSRGMLAVTPGTGGFTRERYEFWLAPAPDGLRDERLIDPEINSLATVDGPNILHTPIEIYRSTGKVKIIQ